MPDVTESRPPLDLDAVRETWLRPCGSCDAGLPMGCTHPTGEDYRPVMARLVGEVEALNRLVADQASGSLNQLVGLTPSGTARNMIAAMVAALQRELAQDGGRADG